MDSTKSLGVGSAADTPLRKSAAGNAAISKARREIMKTSPLAPEANLSWRAVKV
jgi:hypothetical protein